MKDSFLQIAKREMHAFRTKKPVWICTLAAGLLLGLAGPFGTIDVMPLLGRMVYWCVLAVVTYLTGSILNAALWDMLRGRLSDWGIVVLASVITATAITAEILVLNAAVFQFFPSTMGLFILTGNVFVASFVISGAAALINTDASEPDNQATDTSDGPRILVRLPLAKRGSLVSMSSVDHYVEVTTANGTELVLMRLSDAIAETDPIEGLQIHRSHWVAIQHVRDVARASGKATLTLSDGRTLPVSRSNLPRLKQAGLLPG